MIKAPSPKAHLPPNPKSLTDPYPAANWKRFSAFFIDTLLLFAVVSALHALIPINRNVITLIWLAYYIGMHSYFGFTLGKKIFSLEVVHSETNEKPRFLAIVGRETIGRTLSYLTVFGLLWIYFTKSGESLHDRLFRTHVVSFSHQDRRRPLVSLAIVFGTIGVSITLLIYAIFYTNTYLRMVANSLRAHGVVIEGVEGNLAQGFTVHKLNFENDDLRLQAEEIRIAYDGEAQMFSQDSKIEELSIDNLSVTLRDPVFERFIESIAKNGLQKTIEDQSSGRVVKYLSQMMATFLSQSTRIEQLNLKRVTLNEVGSWTRSIERVDARGLDFSKSHVKLDSVYFDSDFLRLHLTKLDVETNPIQVQKIEIGSLDLILRAAAFPLVLVADVDLRLTYNANIGSGEYFIEMNAFRQKVKIASGNLILNVKIENFYPQQFLRNVAPISALQFSYAGSPQVFLPLETSEFGYYLYNRKFKINQVKDEDGLLIAASEQAGVQYKTKLIPNFQFVFDTQKPIYTISLRRSPDASPASSLDALMAEIIYSKPEKDLTSDELQRVKSQLRYFQLQ